MLAFVADLEQLTAGKIRVGHPQKRAEKLRDALKGILAKGSLEPKNHRGCEAG